MSTSARADERNRVADEPARDDRPEDTEDTEIRAQEIVEEDPGGSDGRIQEALDTAATVAEETGGLGTPGRPINKRSPFMIGLTGALGVAVAFGLIELVIRARSVLIIIGLAVFIAAGLD